MSTHRVIDGPAGNLEIAFDAVTSPHSVAIVCHPHPLFGGSMDNKVVTTVTKALNECNASVVRFNFRGVGNSAGEWDEGRGEMDDAMAALAHARLHFGESLPVRVCGFSFGGYIAARIASKIPTAQKKANLLISPAVSRFDVGDVAVDSIVIQGETDDVVPLADVLAWARPQALPITVIPGAGHFFHGQLIALKNAVKSRCQC